MDKRTYANGYFKSFIQSRNKVLLASHSMVYKRRHFIPEEDAKVKSFQMRYQTYMEILEDKSLDEGGRGEGGPEVVGS
jgi:hypothetical protein